jgi:hypothetical protein
MRVCIIFTPDEDIQKDPNERKYTASAFEGVDRSKHLYKNYASNDYLYSRDMLLVVKQVLEEHNQKDLILTISDLNLCLATGRVTSGIKDVELDPQVKKTFERVCKALNKFNCNTFPCFPAKDHIVGRYKSVLRGLYHIYQSPFVVAPSFLEVRFKRRQVSPMSI